MKSFSPSLLPSFDKREKMPLIAVDYLISLLKFTSLEKVLRWHFLFH